MGEKKRALRFRSIVQEIGLRPGNVMDFEECEIISDLMDDGAVASVKDPELRRILGEMRRLHEGVRRENYPAFERAAEERFARIQRPDWILKYHEAEGLAKSLDRAEIEGSGERSLVEAYEALRHVHDGIAGKKAKVLAGMDLK